MRKILTSESRWVWLFVLLLAGLLALGLMIMPAVLEGGYAAPGLPAGLYVMNLLTLALFLGVLVALAVGYWQRFMIILFVAVRIGEVAWQYGVGRHSLWYLAGSIVAHLIICGLVLACIQNGQCRRR